MALYRKGVYPMIVKAKISHAGEIARLAAKMWDSHEIEELTGEFAELLGKPEAAVFLWIADGQPVGFAQVQLRHDYVEGTDTSPVGYLEGVFVEAAYRKQGVAKKLLAACESWAKEMGCTEFASDCELSNTQSLAFHLHAGFQEANRIICFTKKL